MTLSPSLRNDVYHLRRQWPDRRKPFVTRHFRRLVHVHGLESAITSGKERQPGLCLKSSL